MFQAETELNGVSLLACRLHTPLETLPVILLSPTHLLPTPKVVQCRYSVSSCESYHRTNDLTRPNVPRDCHAITRRSLIRKQRIMATADAPYKQDLPPKGGYPKIQYARNLPKRGPSGLVIMLGGVAVMAVGLYVVGRTNKERR